MSRRVAVLKPQLNRIRAWAHEGSTDAWIAHQLETTAETVRAFRQEHGIERGGPAPLAPITPDSVVEAMLAEEAAALEAGPEPEAAAHAPAEDDAAAESAPARAPRRRAPRRPVADVDAAPEAEAAPDTADTADEAPAKPSRRRGTRSGAARTAAATETAEEPASAPAAADAEEDEDGAAAEQDAHDTPAGDDEPGARSSRKRGRRRGRGRGSRGLEARLLHGSVLLLDPSVASDATFQEHWQGGGPLRVEVSADAIVLRRIVHADADSERSDRSHNA
jgi:transcription termination factor Rho